MVDAIKLYLKAQDKTKAAFKSVDKSMTNLERSTKALGVSLGPIAAFASAGALLYIGKQALSSADEINKMSQRIGASTEALSQYQHAAKLSGIEFRTLTMGWQRMTRRVSEAARGYGEAKGALAELNLEAVALNRMAPERQFETITDALNGVENQADKVRLAMKLFDSEGVSLIQMMGKGSAGLREMTREADGLGLTLTQDMADGASEAEDAIAGLSSALNGMKQTLATTVAGPLADFLNMVVETATSTDPIHEMARAFAELEEVSPEGAKRIRDMQKATGDFTSDALLAAVAAEMLAASFRSIPEYGGFAGDMEQDAIRQWREGLEAEGAAMNAALKDFSDGFDEIEEALIGGEVAAAHDQLLSRIRAQMEAISDANQTASESARGSQDEASETARVLEQEGVRASDAFGDAIVDAALRGEDALTSLGNVASSIFGQILSSFIGIGVRSILPGAGSPIDPGFIGPLQSSAGGGVTNNFGDLNLQANSTLNQDPMSVRRLAEQLIDEIGVVSSQRGPSGS